MYRSLRIGKGGVPFTLFKFRTLKENTDKTSLFAKEEQYTRFGKILRKTKIDELLQVVNWIKREINLVGPRPEEERTISILPEDIREILLSRRPGLTSLASIQYFDEGQVLEKSSDPYHDYWVKIKPTKIALDIFYIQNKCVLLDMAILWMTFKKVFKSLFIK